MLDLRKILKNLKKKKRKNYYTGPGSLIITVACYAASYHGCDIYLCPPSPKIAVVFRIQNYKTAIERRSYVSCINIIELFDLPVCSF